MVDRSDAINAFKSMYRDAKSRLVANGNKKPTTEQIIAEMRKGSNQSETQDIPIQGFHMEYSAQTKYMPPVRPHVEAQTKYMPPVKSDGGAQTKYMPPVKPDGEIQTKYMPPVK